ncbi:MAG: chorismate mutase [Methanobacterium sp. BRmetb2]|nr:MAG: chorismate mutase [Methanobacterium sp. BRmetb2]
MDKSDALRLLEKSRKEIDRIDEEILYLISERTSLARDVANAKIVLDMDIEDKKREYYIQEKTKKIAEINNIEEKYLSKVMEILTDLNKNEQEKILRRK